jgi:NAD-dependent deacetylase
MKTNISAVTEASEVIQKSNNVVIFSGAGISAESGIPTFRDKGGIWSKYEPMIYATKLGLFLIAILFPKKFLRFLADVLEPICNAKPNKAHLAVKELEKYKDVVVITQNIDGLHQEAGSTKVYEIHGSIFEIISRKGKKIETISKQTMQTILNSLKGLLEERFSSRRFRENLKPLLNFKIKNFRRPNVVLFGEKLPPNTWFLAYKAVIKCDCFISIGTSGVVWPATRLLDIALSNGAEVISIGEGTIFDTVSIIGKAGEVIPKIIQNLDNCSGDKNGR